MPRRQRGWLRSWRDRRSAGAPAPARVLAHATGMLANQNLQPRNAVSLQIALLGSALAFQAPRGLPGLPWPPNGLVLGPPRPLGFQAVAGPGPSRDRSQALPGTPNISILACRRFAVSSVSLGFCIVFSNLGARENQQLT